MSERISICLAKLVDLNFQTRVIKVADSLVEFGYEVTIVGLASRMKTKPSAVKGAKLVLIDAYSNKWNYPLSRLFRIIEKSARYLKVLWNDKPDAYCAHDMVTLFFVSIISIFRNVAIIYIGDELEYGRNVNGFKGFVRNKISYFLYQILLIRCDVVLQADESRRIELERKFGLSDVKVLRNVPKIKSNITSIDIKDQLSLPQDTMTMLYQGSLGRGRGIEISISAVSKLSSQRKIALIIIGWGEAGYLSFLDDLIKREKKKNPQLLIHRIDPVDSDLIWEWIFAADVGLSLIENTSLSYFLSTPTKVYEHMMAGVPVVASNFPENTLLIDKGNFGLLVDPSDIDDIAAAFKRLFDDPNLRIKLGKNGKKLALDEYNWEYESEVLKKSIWNIFQRKFSDNP